MTDTNQNVIPF